MQPLSNNVRGCFTIEFQSSSGQKAGCNSRVDSYCLTPRAFQSSSGQKAGCNLSSQVSASVSSVFQSSSGQKAGCNEGAWAASATV